MTSTVELRRATSIVCRVVQQLVGQRLDLVREGGREQQVLALLRQHGQHFLDVVEKPMSSMRSASSSTRISTFETLTVRWPMWSSRRPGVATRMSTPCLSCLICGLMPTPPKTTARVQVGVLAVDADAFLDLGSQFAGRRQHQRADRARGGAVGGRGRRQRQALQQRQREAGGLAGAGLGAGQQVAAGQHDRDGLRLDRRRDGVAGFGHGANERVGQTEGIK